MQQCADVCRPHLLLAETRPPDRAAVRCGPHTAGGWASPRSADSPATADVGSTHCLRSGHSCSSRRTCGIAPPTGQRSSLDRALSSCRVSSAMRPLLGSARRSVVRSSSFAGLTAAQAEQAEHKSAGSAGAAAAPPAQGEVHCLRVHRACAAHLLCLCCCLSCMSPPATALAGREAIGAGLLLCCWHCCPGSCCWSWPAPGRRRDAALRKAALQASMEALAIACSAGIVCLAM